MTLTAHLTPGHTMGCTTWTFDVSDTVGYRRYIDGVEKRFNEQLKREQGR